MAKKLLFAALLSLGFGSVAAQTSVSGEDLASKQFKQRLREQYLHNDTAQAIIALYSRRQAGGISWFISSLLAAVRVGTAATTSTSNYGGYANTQQDRGSNVGAVFLVATPIAAYGIVKFIRFSNANLDRELNAYAAGRPLPHSLRRKLKPRFFREPIVKYKSVPYKPVN